MQHGRRRFVSIESSTQRPTSVSERTKPRKKKSKESSSPSCNTHVRRPSKCTRPEFPACQCGAVDDPRASLLSSLQFRQEGCRGFQSSDVRTVSQFRLCVATDHSPIATEGEPPSLLFVVTQTNNVGLEHDPMECWFRVGCVQVNCNSNRSSNSNTNALEVRT